MPAMMMPMFLSGTVRDTIGYARNGSVVLTPAQHGTDGSPVTLRVNQVGTAPRSTVPD